MARSSAPGKLILCGEHAVVYGQPAIALPVAAVAATATVMPEAGGGIVVALPDLDERWRLDERPEHPLAGLIRRTLDVLGVSEVTPLAIVLESTIPIASGMGSGAALGAALVQALARHFGRPLDAATVSG
ncbi:MAG: mevalonate kinase, partial [Chloroflexota bacterium]|nr:mevalonate kinase [Chloroflexota bacterium]